MTTYPFLVGRTINLRLLDATDVTDEYVAWLNDPQVTRTMVAGNFPQSRDSIVRFLREMAPPHAASFAICDRQTDRHVGNVALRHIDWINRHAEVGILVGDRTYWRRGVAREAVTLLTRYSFETLKLRKLHTGTTGEAAAGLFDALGWTREGLQRRHVLVGGEWCDHILFGLLADEFRPAEARE